MSSAKIPLGILAYNFECLNIIIMVPAFNEEILIALLTAQCYTYCPSLYPMLWVGRDGMGQ